MAAVWQTGLFWAVSILGYRICRYLKTPAPAILGPILFFVLLPLAGMKITAPSWQKPVLSVATGILLGLRFNHKLKGIVRYMLLAGVWIVFLSLFAAYVLILTGIPKETALFSATPGGMAEITLLSLSYHSDAFVTVLLQSFRMICSMVVFSSLAARYRRKEAAEETAGEGKAGEGTAVKRKATGWLSFCQWAAIIGIALLAAAGLDYLKVPSAKLLGPMLAVGCLVRAKKIVCRPDPGLQRLVQIGIGGLAGASVARESILGFMQYLIPALILNVLIIGGSLLLAKILIKYTGWDKATCILSCCPAGLSPTIMVAMEYGADANIVTVFQVLRMVTVLIVTPFAAVLIL